MKTMKKTLALLIVVMMIAAMLPNAFAEDPEYTLTINNNDPGHTYEAYQIFSGKLSNNKLTEIVWGSGITENGKTALQNKYDSATEEASRSASGVAAALNNDNALQFSKDAALYLTDVKTVSTYSDPNYMISGLKAGYYLIKDKDNSLVGADDAYTAFILRVVESTSANPKSAKPTVDKQVLDEVGDAEANSIQGWGETADHAINEPFQFKLIGSLTSDTNYKYYDKYKVVFTDTMSEGVTFDSIESVSVDGIVIGTDKYTTTAVAGTQGGSWTLTIADIKSVEGINLDDGARIVVIYNAHLNEKAQVNHESGNTTNRNGVYLEYSNNPNAGGEASLGKTQEDFVWVFTYEVDNVKMDATNPNQKTPLKGAGFRLYDSTGTTEIELIYDATLSAYRPVKADETAEEMMSAEGTGAFNIKGLDAGSYVLKETTVPAGYNKCADINLVVSAEHIESSNASATTTLSSTSTMTNTIENKSGATLPETGGIGTTMFYVIGSILVIGAVVLLVSKKRMNAAE